MKSLEMLLQPVVGYVELGMYKEAQLELDNLPTEVQSNPLVQLARMDLFIETDQWKEGISLGASLCNSWPDEAEFWIKTAYCLHELKRTTEAKAVLTAAPPAHRKLAIYSYNMACYESQLGHFDEAAQFLKESFKKDRRYREGSLNDPDLKPLWNQLQKQGVSALDWIS